MLKLHQTTPLLGTTATQQQAIKHYGQRIERRYYNSPPTGLAAIASRGHAPCIVNFTTKKTDLLSLTFPAARCMLAPLSQVLEADSSLCFDHFNTNRSLSAAL